MESEGTIEAGAGATAVSDAIDWKIE